MKCCTSCGETKDIKEFYSTKGMVRGKCKTCCRAWFRDKYHQGGKHKRREYYLQNKDRIAQRIKNETYKITTDQYAEMIESQSSKCCICQEELTKPHIDHCHQSGQVRGILCRHCNHGLGNFRDDPARLISAAEYLRSHAPAE